MRGPRRWAFCTLRAGWAPNFGPENFCCKEVMVFGRWQQRRQWRKQRATEDALYSSSEAAAPAAPALRPCLSLLWGAVAPSIGAVLSDIQPETLPPHLLAVVSCRCPVLAWLSAAAALASMAASKNPQQAVLAAAEHSKKSKTPEGTIQIDQSRSPILVMVAAAIPTLTSSAQCSRPAQKQLQRQLQAPPGGAHQALRLLHLLRPPPPPAEHTRLTAQHDACSTAQSASDGGPSRQYCSYALKQHAQCSVMFQRRRCEKNEAIQVR